MISPDVVAQADLREGIGPYLDWLANSQNGPLRRLANILGTIEAPAFPGAIIPVLSKEAPRLRFYAVTSDQKQWRQLQPLLSASIGMTLTDFSGRPGSQDVQDAIEAEFAKRNLLFTRFVAPADRRVSGDAVKALERLVTLKSKAPALDQAHPRPVAEVLYVFDLAVTAGNQDVAAQELQELTQRQLLDVANLHFLEVRLLSEFHEWRRLRDQPWFAALSRTRRPPAVTAALIEAIYEADVAPAPDDAKAMVEAFLSHALPDAGDLFVVMPDRRSPAMSIAFLIQALLDDDSERIETLREEPTLDWPRPLASRFAALLASRDRPERDARATTAAGLVPADRLTNLEQRSTAELLQILTQASASGTLKDIEAMRQIAALLLDRQAEPAIPDEIDIPETPVPTTWVEYFQLLGSLDYADARRIADQAADEWPIEAQLTSPASVTSLTNAVAQALDGDHRTRALAAIPHLIRWVQSDPRWPNPDLRSLYEGLYTAILLAEVHNQDAFRNAGVLLDAMLTLGLSAGDYKHALDDLRNELRFIASASTLDLLLDAAELTTLHPCQDVAARTALWSEVLSLMRQYAPALLEQHRQLAASLGSMLGVSPDLPPAAASADALPQQWQGNIGIYTLREDVAKRASGLLGELFPKAHVRTNQDHVATSALLNLGTADVLAIAWTAAKHAATDALKRAATGRVVWVAGGASSLVSAVVKEVERLASPD